ncbi:MULTISPECIES: 16S rRNA (uracil(1498)-N(3))-methyltransferase [unclassified Flavobacterium]|uniref:16S rRNA (uracil(1498)-N(3))-methyltransferase n=1 Tax=unclassified Flavobacterium TaxID=196869 RepID=UPI00129294E2|nr:MULTISPECIES: 16S rRNA (uracil(1498)-N(3))-methyltransferase [unclassified Flavobacterium]MQP53510.1 16S rRNA (uracil(1498)-N(3))-methyltransferase [Flavobacterium sp. LMO9]MQP63387.1 16S rRNA (uracil(1498)-N(3))-methyltransferase [Flavobacterium sp. LMO6]
MQLFYNSEIKQGDSTYFFDKEESKHIVKVLRKKEGDTIFITNGLGFLFESEIILASEKKCEVKIAKETFQEPVAFYTHIAVAPTKMNDRLEWFLEKATEIGIHEITPIICDHSERKVYKIDRAEKIIQAAMKQSLHYYLPKINEPISFSQFVKLNFEGQKFIAHCEETDKKSFKNEIKQNSKITILIGPEGDFSTKEINLSIANQFIPVTLGNTRLRTETAALVACHTIALQNE